MCFRGWMVREPVILELAGSRCVVLNPTYDCTWERYSRRCWACSEFVSVRDRSPGEKNSKGLSKHFSVWFLSLFSFFLSFQNHCYSPSLRRSGNLRGFLALQGVTAPPCWPLFIRLSNYEFIIGVALFFLIVFFIYFFSFFPKPLLLSVPQM